MQDHDEQWDDQRRGQQDAAHAVNHPLFHRVEFPGGAYLLLVLLAQRQAAKQ
ncbi:hypothetical protein [Streptomyces brasiliensis]|uniref:Uncharacterized protein n=1 Tax=Streptomyces brasiliensis TaxID=1954 RepID=A0A917LE61_9ACTN|nr:hypothetical protein [Streptomyces brasiliensis]GGJ58393.1 hypothetical protein GCM10010121_081260 [Streptomyces brasiliensis]